MQNSVSDQTIIAEIFDQAFDMHLFSFLNNVQ